MSSPCGCAYQEMHEPELVGKQELFRRLHILEADKQENEECWEKHPDMRFGAVPAH